MAKILENPNVTSFDIESLIHGSMKEKLPEPELAIDGYITPEQAAKLMIIKEHFDNLEARKAELEKLILALASPYQQEITIILTAPGFKNNFTAIGVISEIGTNMEAFPSAKHLCSWAGLTPTSNESAGKKKSVQVSKHSLSTTIIPKNNRFLPQLHVPHGFVPVSPTKNLLP